MAECQPIRAKHRKVCVGDMEWLITLEDRAIQPPSNGVDPTELFSAVPTGAANQNEFDDSFGSAYNGEQAAVNDGQVWAMIITVTGEEVFDERNVGTAITHHVYIEYLGGIVTAETWVKLEDGTRLNIADVQNLDERNEYLLLRCVAAGSDEFSKNEL